MVCAPTPQILVGKRLGFGSFRRGTIPDGQHSGLANREIFIFWHRNGTEMAQFWHSFRRWKNVRS
jgi:hypothetical protein